MDNQELKKYAKTAAVVVVIVVILVTLIVIIRKTIKSKNAKNKREELIKVVHEQHTPDKKTYASVAVELEKLIFNEHSKVYGWEADIDGILKLMATYSKEDFDKVLEAYAMIYRPDEAGGTYLGEVIGPFDYLFAPRKTYTGNAFSDLENIEDEKDYKKVLEAYKLLK